MQLIKLSLFCTFSHPLRTLAAVAVACLCAGAVIFFVPLIVIVPAVFWYLQCRIWNPVLKAYSTAYEGEEEEDVRGWNEEDIIEEDDEYKVIRLGKLIIRKRKKPAAKTFDDDDGWGDTAETPRKRGDRVVPKSEVDNAD